MTKIAAVALLLLLTACGRLSGGQVLHAQSLCSANGGLKSAEASFALGQRMDVICENGAMFGFVVEP